MFNAKLTSVPCNRQWELDWDRRTSLQLEELQNQFDKKHYFDLGRG